ncbi:MAG: cupin domain-containing protein [Acidobacteriota bacterium]
MVAKVQTSPLPAAGQVESSAQTARPARPQIHIPIAELPSVRFNPRFTGKIFEGERLSIVCSEVQAGFTVPKHKHENEQVTVIQSGVWQFNVAGEEFIACCGDIVHVPAGWEHSAIALETSTIMEIFTPPRCEWSDDMDDYLWGI